MSVLESLPPRPLPESAVAALNRSESVDIAVSVGVTTGSAKDAETDEGDRESGEPGGPATGLLVVTDSWAKGLALAPEAGWQVVETVSLDDTERFEALQRAEDAVLAFQAGESEQSD